MIDSLDNPGVSNDPAKAYLDASITLCSQMLNGDFKSSYSHSRVILSLAYHSIELFLKGAILKKTGKAATKGHELDNLEQEYLRLYTDDEFAFDVPFNTEYLGFSRKQIEDLRKQEPPLDQTFRYHTDLSRSTWI